MKLIKYIVILFLVFNSFNATAKLSQIEKELEVINANYKEDPEPYAEQIFSIYDKIEKDHSQYTELELIEILHTIADIMVYYPEGEDVGFRLNDWGIELSKKNNSNKIAYFYLFKAMYLDSISTDFDKIKKAYKTTIKAALLKNQTEVLSSAYSFLAEKYSYEGNLKIALENYKKAESYATETIEVLNIKYGIAILFYSLNVHELAISHVKDALKIIEISEQMAIRKIDYYLMFYQMLSIMYIKTEDYETAFYYSKMNVDLSKDYYDKFMEINAYLTHASIVAHLGMFEESKKYQIKGKELFEQTGVKDRLLIYNNHFAKYHNYFFQKDYENAKKELKKLEQFLLETEPDNVFKIYDRISKVLHNLDEYKESLDYMKKYTAYYIDLRNEKESLLSLFLHENYKDVRLENQNKSLEQERLNSEMVLNENQKKQLNREKHFILSIIAVIFILIIIAIFQYFYIKTKKIAISDVLTNSYNRHFALEKINKIIKQQKQLTAFLFDIDNFKKINDTCGHEVGDEVLIQVVDIINERLSKNQTVSRVGGEEFLILSEDVSEDLAENIRKDIELFDFPKVGKVTISGGNSFYKKNVNIKFENLYKELDKKLYQAKEAGKNLVVF